MAKLVYIPKAHVWVNPRLVSSVYYDIGLATIRMNSGTVYRTDIPIEEMVALINDGEEA